MPQRPSKKGKMRKVGKRSCGTTSSKKKKSLVAKVLRLQTSLCPLFALPVPMKWLLLRSSSSTLLHVFFSCCCVASCRKAIMWWLAWRTPLCPRVCTSARYWNGVEARSARFLRGRRRSKIRGKHFWGSCLLRFGRGLRSRGPNWHQQFLLSSEVSASD